MHLGRKIIIVVEVNVLVSALAGAGSFFSPCILPILPAFISYLSGTTLNELQNNNAGATGRAVSIKKATRLNIFLNTVYFVLGFSLVFAVLGVVLNSILVTAGIGFQSTLATVGGIVIIAFGSYLILSTRLRKLNFEKRMTSLPKFKTSYITSFVFGARLRRRLDTLCRTNTWKHPDAGCHCTWSRIQFIIGIFVRIGNTIPHNRSVLLTGNWNNKKDGEASKVL